MITVINLTSHAVTVTTDGRTPVVFPPSGPIARIRELLGHPRPTWTESGQVTLQSVRYADDVDDLPRARPGVLYLVSRVAAAAIPRKDLVFPQGELRDQRGRIVGCRSLGYFEPGPETLDA